MSQSNGDFTVVSLELDDPERAFTGIATSQDPFDQWFRENGKELWGVDLSQPQPGPFATLVFDGLP